ncbi:probable peroxygenase 5 isoform X3 [Nicotiana tomentosiformis]|uniref:probable peroxygenase 5 isoform X3 n=1 Tax=Nicotiana tomentosiformis TaxID=4098 RepID=UPI00051C97D2|nr:probable peroxygenase 5 isoform X4 [Nicotiana tomentosiformis]
MASSSSLQPDGMGNHDEPTPLGKHVMFFDINKDGIIYPWETYQGLRKLGHNIFRSLLAAVLIHLVLSHKTRPGKWPSLLFPIVIKNIKYGKHGSDSDAYDAEGRLNASTDWRILYDLAKDKNGELTKEAVRAVYDGSLFEQMARENASKKSS